VKIVILTSETPANVWLVNQILQRFEVNGVVIERRPLALTREDKYRRRHLLMRRYGLIRTVNKLVYNWAKSRVLTRGDGDTIKQQFFPADAPVCYERQLASIVVENINDEACIDFIKGHGPDVLAVCGTGLLKRRVFSLARKGTLNIHTGITPEYRSADPIFWALYHAELDKVGVTVHFIDEGIDTGPILHQEQVPIYAGDQLASIYARCIRRGADLYLRSLSEIEAGSVRVLDRRGVEGKSFSSIDLGILQYLLFRLRFRRIMSQVPQEGMPAASARVENDR